MVKNTRRSTRKELWDSLDEETQGFIRALLAIEGMSVIRIERGDLVWSKNNE